MTNLVSILLHLTTINGGCSCLISAAALPPWIWRMGHWLALPFGFSSFLDALFLLVSTHLLLVVLEVGSASISYRLAPYHTYEVFLKYTEIFADDWKK